MAIGFARLEFVQRSAGKNACAKSAYIGRDKIHFKGTEFAEAKTYNWSRKDPVSYHEILLPKHVSLSFLKAEVLWNTAEAKENRSNSQTAMEAVLALPDDLEISLEDKIELAKSFVQKNFVDKGLGAELVIHPPEKKIQLSSETKEIENLEHNWHAHILLTTRRFKENGEELEDKKARDLMPTIRNGKVITGPNWGEIWTEHQNQYFESKGMSLRVDPNGIVAQVHLGPVRLRGRALAILEKNEMQKELNVAEICNPAKLLEKITEKTNIFSREDLTRLIHKFIGPINAKELVDAAIKQKNVIQLFDRETGKLPFNLKTGEIEERYTTMEVLLEEKRCLLHADKIQQKEAFHVNLSHCFDQFSSKLTSEQKVAFENILKGRRLNCIEGHAGTGKSHLLVALKNAYESEGYIVRAFGPDSATTEVLKEKGFSNANNVYQFLFSVNRFEKNQVNSIRQSYRQANNLKRGSLHFAEKKANKPTKEGLQISKGKEIWLIDEATKLGNRPMQQILKFAKKYDVQVVFSGGASQLLPVERGCLYDVFAKRYGSQKLEDIQRQKDAYQREISKKIAKGEMASAIDRLSASGSIIWVDSKKEEPNPTIQGFIDSAFGEKLEYNDRTKAIEELLKKWAADREAFPSNSSIIIACSNQEVKAINELVRTYRKEKGEIAKEEFNYETEFGNIFVSQGDTIEFSSNNKDLGVTNGMQGTLMKASSNEFTVLVKDKEGKPREISVDPNKYASFKLGYATTYFRSQGRTLDRAYILHSIHTNKEMFYVGLTRHVNKAYLFVPKSNFHYLSYLKAQAAGFDEGYGKYLALNHYFRGKEMDSYLSDLAEQVSQESSKFATSDFISKEEQQKLEKDLYIDELKHAASPFSRLKGYSLSLWNQVSTTIEDYKQNKTQEKKEAEFFNPVIKKLEEKIRLKEESVYEPTAQEYRQAFVKSLLLTKDKSLTSSPQVWEHLPDNQQQLVSNYLDRSSQAWRLYYKVEKEKEQNSASLVEWQKVCEERNTLASSLIKNLPKEAIYEILGEKYFETLRTQSAQHKTFNQIKKNETSHILFHNHPSQLLKTERTAIEAATKSLSPDQKTLLKNYQQISKESSSLYALVQAETENEQQSATHHTAWKVTCGKRNAAAYQLLKFTPPEILSNTLSQKSYEFLTEQAERHERLIKRNETRLEDLDTKLKDNLEPLLYSLFPEGPIRKSRGEWRFGSKGSLVVTCQGEKMGSFYSFAEEKGGGPLQLIQTTLGLDAKQARDWAKDFVGEAKDILVPPSFKIKSQRVVKETEWISIKPNMQDPAPLLRNIPNCKLARYCKEEARYPYQNEKGELLFYTVRLVDKNGKKSVLPLSYGCGKDKNEAPHWAFKAYQTTQRPLYNLQLLQQNLSSKVIIVEGEKTADAANRLLNKHDMICLTWLGGASATAKTDWSPLEGREVIIWPDNDQPGFKAAGHICSELRKLGTKSLKVVDEQTLTKLFPPKWDLADALPDGKKENFIRDLIFCAQERAVDMTHLSFAVDKSNRDIELLRVREILWRVEERLRPELETTLKDKPQDIRAHLIKETLGIYKQKDQVTEDLKKQLNIDKHQAERLTFQTLLYKAEHGQDPTQSKLVEMKTVMQNAIALLRINDFDKHLSKEIHALATDKALTFVFNNQKGNELNEVKESFEKEISKTNQYFQQISHEQQKNRGMDLSI